MSTSIETGEGDARELSMAEVLRLMGKRDAQMQAELVRMRDALPPLSPAAKGDPRAPFVFLGVAA